MPSTGGTTRTTAYGTITNTVLNLTDSGGTVVTMPAEIRGFQIFNPNPDNLYLKIWNDAAANITIGSDEPDEVYELPGNQTVQRQSVEVRPWVVHSPRVSYAITTQREAGGSAAGTACEGTISFGCATLTREFGLV